MERRRAFLGLPSSCLLLLCLAAAVAAEPLPQYYNAIFSFGDSFSDTGNFVIINSGKLPNMPKFPPPYARCSNGRLVIDFLAEAFGLPLLPPSANKGVNFSQGANFAVMGATALDLKYFKDNNVWSIPPFNTSMSVQLQWFDEVKQTICSEPQECRELFGKALFVFGEFGGNDYNAMLFGNYNADQASTYTPTIVDTISNGIEKLIAMGATDIVVPGVLPIGCFPIYLTIYGTSNSGDYDSLGCLKKFNDLSTYHNNQLQTKVANLQAKYSSARIMYADFYSGVYDMVKNPQSYGFSTVFETCCGSGGGKYNYQNSARCGMAGASACANPAAHLSWDGIHLTEAAYKQITDGWLNGPYCRPAILHS